MHIADICDMQTLRDVIDAFGYAELAAILGKRPGTVSSWKTRGMLPSEYWREVIQAAKKLKIKGITPELLIRLDAERVLQEKLKQSPRGSDAEERALR